MSGTAAPGDGTAAIVATDITRVYELDGVSVSALRGVSLTVQAADYLAIVGSSGSGKSTLMHLLGALDRPSSGRLLIGGRDVATLSPPEMAQLRNETIGFVFQSFHLLARTSAMDNVALPLVYRGVSRRERRARAREMLERVGLGHRVDHRPNQMSGGEQQRVAVARALVTGPSVLLADEPTGNLDTVTGRSVLALLESLNDEGVAVVVVTHDREVAARAHRQIVMRDGVIVPADAPDPEPAPAGEPPVVAEPVQGARVRLAEAWRVALDALRANRLRSILTMLGVVIGVAAVVALVAIGTGAKQQVEQQVEGLGSNLLVVVPGRLSANAPPAVSTMSLDDAEAVSRVVGDPSRVAVTISAGETLRAGTRSSFVSMQGVLETTPTVFVRRVDRGSYFTRTDVDTSRRVAVLGATVAEQLFGDRDPVGRQVSIAGVRFRVIGTFEPLGQSLGVDRDSEVHVPVTAAQRLLGTDRIDALAVRAPDRDRIDALGDAIVAELVKRHPEQDFSAVTQEQILGVLGDILGVLTGVLAAIAGISLLVGGVGVSNIMLVSVRERTREIGLRKAVGARPRDIGVQFLLEAVLLTTLGGLIGMGLGIGSALLVDRLSPVPAAITWWSLVLAFGVSAAVGIVFGVVPAQRAGRLDPVVALRTE